MKYYMAPLEGITGYVYRNAYSAYFPKFDKYFTPFLSPHGEQEGLMQKERKDVAPEHNEGLYVVPQILTNKAADFIWLAKYLQKLGYEEINLNLGCPSGTVVPKGKGAGFLAKPQELQAFLSEIFEKTDVKISIKTRIGMEHVDEFKELLDIYNQFPMEELIIHPRLRQEFYKGMPHREVYMDAEGKSKNPLCYNGDLFFRGDVEAFTARPSCPAQRGSGMCDRGVDYSCGIAADKCGGTMSSDKTQSLMLGRGVLRNPGILQLVQAGTMPPKELVKEFHDRLYGDYRALMPGDKPALYKMKELWFYMGTLFTGWEEGHAKKIRKANSLRDYEETVKRIFTEEVYAQI